MEFEIFEHEFVFVSCGDYDGNQLKREAELKNIPLPNYLRRFINMKKGLSGSDALRKAAELDGPSDLLKPVDWDHKINLNKAKV